MAGRVRMSAAQASLFGDKLATLARKPGAPRQKQRKEDLPENIIEGQICGLLRARGWTVERNHVGSFIPTGVVMRLLESGQALTKETLFRSIVRVGVRGDPDWRADRVVHVAGVRGITQHMFFECKAPGKRPSPVQLDRIRVLKVMGWIVDYFDDFNDFPGPHSFVTFYRQTFGEI